MVVIRGVILFLVSSCSYQLALGNQWCSDDELKAKLLALDEKLDSIIDSFSRQRAPDLETEERDTTLFITAGLPEHDGVVEVLQLKPDFSVYKPDKICRRRSPFKFTERFVGPVGIPLEDRILFCGGNHNYDCVRKCFAYHFREDKWIQESGVDLITARMRAKAIQLNNGTWWILGGVNVELGDLDSTEIFDPRTKSFSPGVQLPVPSSKHCVIKINSTHFFFTNGGGSEIGYSAKAWLFDVENEKWLSLPDTIRERSGSSYCGYVERRGFSAARPVIREVVVAGGAFNSFAKRATEVLDLETLEWRQGPPLPDENFSADLAVPHGKSFVIFDSEFGIFEYIEESWVRRPEKRLTRRRGIFGTVAIQVPDEIC